MDAHLIAQVLAQENGGVLVRSFIIAIVLMAPVALWQRRRIKARRAATTESLDSGVPDAAEAPGHRPGTLESLVESLPELAHSVTSGGTVSVEVPDGLTIDGRPAQRAVIEAIVLDALERTGLTVVSIGNDEHPEGTRVIECRRR